MSLNRFRRYEHVGGATFTDAVNKALEDAQKAQAEAIRKAQEEAAKKAVEDAARQVKLATEQKQVSDSLGEPVALFSETSTGPTTSGSTPTTSTKTCDEVAWGSIGCSCKGPNNFCEEGLECSQPENICVQKLPGTELGAPCRDPNSGRPLCDAPMVCNNANICTEQPCFPGNVGCICLDGTCNEGLKCQGGNCLLEDSSSCTKGTAGCDCFDGRCEAGFECISGKCIKKGCPLGDPGCNCKGDGSCNSFEGVDYTCESGVCTAPLGSGSSSSNGSGSSSSSGSDSSEEDSSWLYWLIGGGSAFFLIVIIIIIVIVMNRRR